MKRFVSGFCIGAVDLVPGISGSTIALFLGIYDQLIDSICSPNRANLRFLLPVLLGVGTALLSLSPLIHFLLESEPGRVGLFSLFFGVMIGSTQSCLRRTPPSTTSSKGFLILGILLALIVVNFHPQLFNESSTFFYPLLIIAGMLAVSAMLLPGISGSYMLTAIGAYPLVIKSLSNIFEGIPVLLSVGIGIFFGAVLFTPLIRWGLRNYSQPTHSLMIGFMIGSLPAVWPGIVLPFIPLILLGYSINFIDNSTPSVHSKDVLT